MSAIVYSMLVYREVEDCYTEHLVDDWLKYEDLSPVKYVSSPVILVRCLTSFISSHRDMNVFPVASTITFDVGVYQAWLNAPEKEKHLT